MITVYGSINLDLVTPVDHFPQAGETVLTGACSLLPGGKGANQAVAAARAGATVQMIGAVGDDGFAEIALQGFQASGVDYRAVSRLDTFPTAIAAVMVDQDGENRIVVASNANGAVPDLDPDTVPDHGIALLQMELPFVQTQNTINVLNKKNNIILLNLAPFYPVDVSFIQNIDFLILNGGEALSLTHHLGIDAPDIDRCVAALTALGPTVIVTLGADGFLCSTDERLIRGDALDVDVVDTTGAGDAFCGCLAAALDQGQSLEDALQFAACGASLACKALGAQSAYATGDEIRAALT